MSNLLATSFTAQLKKRTCLAAMISGSLLSLSGCGIPGHRGALSGPPVPYYFSLNNGALHRNSDEILKTQEAMDSESEVVSANKVETESKSLLDSIKLVNFIKTPKVLDLGDTDDSSQGIKPINDETVSPSASNSSSKELVDNILPPPPPVDDTEPGIVNVENSSQLPLNAFFDDPFLVSLINQSLAGNQELRILAEEINIACNEVQARSGEYRPFVTLGAGAGLDKTSRFTRDGAVEDQLEVAPGRGFPEPLPDFMVATNISWELDIWRKLRNAQDAASMRWLGTNEGRNYIVTRLVAEVAENYYELLALDNRMLTLDKTIQIQQQSLEVANSKKEAGRGTELAVQRFQAEVRKNESEKLIIQQEIVEAENRINFLAGRYPQPVERISVEYVDLNLNALSAGLPSQLLQNRADIRQAERAVQAAGLDVEVARARFYPSLGLHAGIGLNAYNMRYLLSTPESLIYNAAIDLVGPLINKRAIQADYRTANAMQLQSIYEYQRTVLNAHIEVVNHMTKVDNYRQSIEIKKDQLEALEASVEVANKLFQNARAEYVEVLLAQRELMEAKMLLIEIKKEQLGAIVNAYQALGGGGF